MMVQRFAHGYDGTLPDGTKVEQGMGNMLTLPQIDATATVRNLHPEARRRYYGMMLEALDMHDVIMGFGTAWRIQPVNAPGHADPGNSWHEKVPFFAYAIDTVPASSWDVRDKLLAKYKMVNFDKPQTGGTNYTGKPYTGPWDAPHIQPYELRYSRAWALSAPDLPKIYIPRKYDVDVVGLNFEEHPLWGGAEEPNPPLTPPDPPIVVPPFQPPVAMPPFIPEARQYGLWPVGAKPRLALGSEGDAVKYLQAVIKFEVARFSAWWLAAGATYQNDARTLYLTAVRDEGGKIVIDGEYGEKTEQIVIWMQNGYSGWSVGNTTCPVMTADGVVGSQQTWPFIDKLADGEWGMW